MYTWKPSRQCVVDVLIRMRPAEKNGIVDGPAHTDSRDDEGEKL
jgi:hypothetical protein